MKGLDGEELARISQQFRHLHPLLIHRSIERAKNLQELSDILSGLSGQVKLPLIWNEAKRRWMNTRLIISIEDEE